MGSHLPFRSKGDGGGLTRHDPNQPQENGQGSEESKYLSQCQSSSPIVSHLYSIIMDGFSSIKTNRPRAKSLHSRRPCQRAHGTVSDNFPDTSLSQPFPSPSQAPRPLKSLNQGQDITKPVSQRNLPKNLAELAKYSAYDPVQIESGWYQWWEKMKFFEPEYPEGRKGEYFVITAPPPNVTGALHIGHALTTALQDCLIRWSRMKGLTTLLLPGCDHAGISTQTVVEKKLELEGKTRLDFTREEFQTELVNWSDKYKVQINQALKRMGGSYDWSREAFTMNEGFTKAVRHTWKQLHDEGLIYRSDALVNWCSALNTSISKIETEKIEMSGRKMLQVPGYQKRVEFGVLHYVRYEIVNSDETITIATTQSIRNP